MDIKIPNLSLVVLIGPSGSGKSTFAKKHFLPTEVLSSDFCRGLVSDDENDQKATNDAFAVLHFIAAKRLAAGKLTVIDATNVQSESRKPLVALAREYHCLPTAMVFNLPEKVCQARNENRNDRDFGPHVIRQQRSQLRRSLRDLKYEGFRHIFVLESEEEVNSATVERIPLWNDKKTEHGPFDIIGDIHGCCDELEQLLRNLGYKVQENQPSDPLWGDKVYTHSEGRKAIFLGDIVDRGPKVLDSLRIVRNMVKAGNAHCVPGNHDMKLMRKLAGKNVQITHGMQQSLTECEALPADVRESFMKGAVEFLDGLVSHYVFDDGKLVVAHAGMKQEMQGRGSGKVRDFALYGETTGETDEFGLPVRYNWAAEYRGHATVVYGHTPVPEPEWLNRTINIDTGCVFGGHLTALRYPEKEIVCVPAANTYCEPAKPFIPEDKQAPALSTQQLHDDLLDAEDVIGKRIVTTRLHSNVTVREENATAALEIMSRFAANPKWLIYLPPTMSPCETSKTEGVLEYPTEAFSHYRSVGVPKVVCEQKHMGSRAVVIVCRDEDAVGKRFGILNDGTGIVYTRTGRRFFEDRKMEQELVAIIRTAMDKTCFWDEFKTDWACLDCELMPWSAKAQQLLETQYAAVGSAAHEAFKQTISALEQTSKRHDVVKTFQVPEKSSAKPADVDNILSRYRDRNEMIAKYITAYQQYCWPVKSLSDLKLAPFHVLATEGKVHVDKDHVWHMETLKKLCGADSGPLLATPYKIVDLIDPQSQESGAAWWEELTSRGGEGMVVKPFQFIMRGKRGLVQPAVKVRGREYLRIIYGPEYTAPEHLDRLRSRNLGAKRSLALREFALGIESLERFVRKEPLRRVHECVFGVLALESEPVDPRL
ncbi:MAG: polynucleotide kinase-phosphatase [Verrucomicrobia bacterium]|nr:polynucleotide kinase-phosphatase [Verrucomicrobiota bacterium]